MSDKQQTNTGQAPGEQLPGIRVRPSLAEALGTPFRDPGLLQSAFIHRSFLNEHPDQRANLTSNERLEFLGDSVLNFLAAAWLYHTYPERSEGELTALRATLVKTQTLARFARELDLGSHIRVSRGENSKAARERPALLADVFEAVLGALYLDQGLDAASAFVQPFFQQELEHIIGGQVARDHRSRLQELVQARYGVTPIYRTVNVSGPDHNREFTIEVLMNEQRLGLGSGTSKQAAAQDAARAALEAFSDLSEEG